MSQDTDQPPVQRQLSHGMIAELFTRHHGSFEQMLAALSSDLKAYIHQEIKTMSENLDQRLADLTALAEKESADNAKFRTDVTAAIAALGTAGAMSPAQQAAFDNVMTVLGATDTATVAADAALTPEPPPAPAP